MEKNISNEKTNKKKRQKTKEKTHVTVEIKYT
jgi:hypothetical protein